MEHTNVYFTEFEKKRLFDLIDRDREIIESRSTDTSDAVYKKREVWERITREYNRHPGVRTRLPQQLKRFWQNENAESKVDETHFYSNALAGNEDVRCFCECEDHAEVDDRTLMTASASSITLPSPKMNNGFEDIDKEMQDEFDEMFDYPIEIKDFAHYTYIVQIDQLVQTLLGGNATTFEPDQWEQAEMHQEKMQQEELKLKAAEEVLKCHAEEHALQMEKERELGNHRVTMHKDVYLKRLRQEREKHQLRMDEYKKNLPPLF